MPNIAFTDPKLDHSILELLVDNMTRFNEAEEADRQGIYHVLGIFENFVGSKPELAERLVLKTKLLPWLLNRAQSKTHDENRGYATELLSILLQGSQLNRLELGKNDGVEILLNIASVRCKILKVSCESLTHPTAISSTRPYRC
jgi:beta-catenin-like protein 1